MRQPELPVLININGHTAGRSLLSAPRHATVGMLGVRLYFIALTPSLMFEIVASELETYFLRSKSKYLPHL